MAGQEQAPNNNSGEPVPFGRTPENDHFFLENGRLVYHGSALIVGLLELQLAVAERVSSMDGQQPPERPLAFFDKEGAFYDSMVLKGLRSEVHANGATVEKHTAIFEPAGIESGETLAIPIDDIYCLSLAKPAGT